MNLLRAAATISGLTLVSRILGLVRETLVASVYGAGALTDAFFVAFRLKIWPKICRILLVSESWSSLSMMWMKFWLCFLVCCLLD